jgi:outer membrane protein TolC
MDQSLASWNLVALNTAAEARNRFLTLVKARESLATRKASLAAVRRVHEENEARVNAGVLAAYELQDSELGVLAREKDLLDAELAERDAADQLRLTLHLPPETVLELPDTPWTDVPDPSEKEALEVALRRRPDLAKARTSLRTAEFNEEISRNLALPALSLEGSAGVTGTATEYGNAIDDMGTGKYQNWAVGLRLSVPLGNSAARADVAAARLKASQARVGVAVLEEAAGLEIRTALRALETRRKQEEVSRKGVSVAETRLASYIKRGKLGLTTTKFVLDAEANLTQARETLSAARADFQSALTSLWKSTGELLDRHSVRIDGNTLASRTPKGTP